MSTDTTVLVLGPIRVEDAAGMREVPAGRQRALLAALAIAAGRSVTVSDLVDAVWDDEPPERARTTLQSYVSRLRRSFGPIIEHGSAGYRLASGVGTDVNEVRGVVARLTTEPPPDPGDRARRALDALDRWDGPALGDLRDQWWFAGAAAELDELHAQLVDLAADALIHEGRAAAAVSLLEGAAIDRPAREPTHVLLVRALHATGRNVEALRAADRYRRWLRDETGLVPGHAFAEAERNTLDDDGDNPSAPHDAAQPRRAVTLARPTPLIGREAELEDLRNAVADNRLVSVTGVGGVGKTRLVAELVDETGDDAWMTIELASVQTGGVAGALGTALDYRAEIADEQALSDLLRSTDTVIILDNCEHVVDEVAHLVRHLLDECPGVRIVTTTRVRLDQPDERLFELAPLAADGPDAAAVRLFTDRLRRARPDLDLSECEPTLLDVCSRLEGVPLALELAASRAAVLGVAALASRLDAQLELLEAGVDRVHRHATLASLIEWSVNLLDPATLRVFVALSAFRADFDLDAAEQIASTVVDGPVAVHLARLVDASLVTGAGEPGRYRLLEMIRQYAGSLLADLDIETPARRAHARWVGHELASVAVAAVGPDEPDTTARLDRLRPDTEAALTWTRLQRDDEDVEIAAAMASSLMTSLLYRPDRELVLAVRTTACDLAEAGHGHPELLAAWARSAFLVGDLPEVETISHKTLDSTGSLTAHHRAAHALGVVRLYQGRFEESRRWFERIVQDEAATVVDRLDALGGLGLALCYAGRIGAAADIAAEHSALADAIDSATYRAFSLYMAGEIALARDEVDEAVEVLAEASELAWSVGASFVWGIASTVLAAVLARQPTPDEARRHLPILIERWRHTATWPQLWTTLRLVAELVRDSGHADVALLVLTAADLDDAAPRLVGADAARLRRLRRELEAELGPHGAAAARSAAAAIGRAGVLDRAVAALSG